ncbi:MAG TPA: diguanylate cyclase, partial [Candidatus Limnocylindria bacterium]|nr:diguanylate cyclase [Candidatus Limnocylindria bacterium]
MLTAGGTAVARGATLPALPWHALTVVAIAATLFGAGLVDLFELGATWEYGFRLLCAVTGTWLGYRGWRHASTPRESLVRGTICIALIVWLFSEAARLASVVAGDGMQPAVEISVAALAAAAAACYVSAAHGRLRLSDEVALYLDAATIFAATSAVMLVLGQAWASDARDAQLLTYAAFFLALLGATAILDLATLAPRVLNGAYGILLGILFGGVGYLAQLVVEPSGPIAMVVHATVGAAALLVGYGGAYWSTAEDRSPRYVAVADLLRGWLPIVAVGLTPILVVLLVVRHDPTPGPARFGAAIAIALVVLFAVIRQTVLLRDREEAVRRERALRGELASAEALYRSVVERVPGVVYVAEAGVSGRWNFVSPKIQELLGYSPEEWMADPDLWQKQIHPADRDRMLLAEQSDKDETYSGSRWEYRLIGRDDRVVWVLDDEEVIARDAAGQPVTVQGILLDISERKKLEEQLRHQALHDPLTGLPNRVLFVDRVMHALTRRRGSMGMAVLFMDIDDFKTINDSLGHAVGDDLLIRVAERVTAVLRAEDTACRLGGDEFAVLLEDVTVAQANAAAEPAGGVLRAEHGGDPLRDANEQVVADGVP